MKIPIIPIFFAVILTACNTVKPDAKSISSVSPPADVDVVRVVINQQQNIRATVYVVADVAMVQVDKKEPQRLTGINPMLYPDFRQIFFRIQDKNRDGFKEIAVLAGTSFAAADLCYDVFHYNSVTGKFTRRLEDFYCTHG
jgi:hypothetical protein